MISAEIHIETEPVKRAICLFGQKFLRRAQLVMDAHGQQYISDLKTSRLSGNPIRARTGNLKRSFKARTYQSALLGGIILDVEPIGPGSRYAPLQEFGGVVRPTKARNLWIPIAGNVTSAGVARITPTEAISRGGYYTKNRRGDGLIFWGSPLLKRSNERSVPLFVLKKSVYVPGRMGANTLWQLSGIRLVNSLDAAASSILGEAA